MSEIEVATPAAPVIPTGTALVPGPSVHEATVALTKVYGPKKGTHISPAELAALERAKLSAEEINAGPAPGELLPSVRESTIAMTEKYGPKSANHVPPSELPKSQTVVPHVDRPLRYPEGPIERATPVTAADTEAVTPVAVALSAAAEPPVPEVDGTTTAAEAASFSPEGAAHGADGKLPSVRESTISATEQQGPEVGHRVPPSELPAEQAAIPEVEPPTPQSHGASAAQVAATATTVAVLPAPISEAPVTGPAVTAIPELVVRDFKGRLPSVRESTIAMTQKYGPKTANHIPPGELGKPVAAAAEKASRQLVKATPTESNSTRMNSEHRPHAVTIPAAAMNAQRMGNGAITSKPIRQWGSEGVKEAASQLMENKVVLTALAVGATALTIFSVYKGVEMFNHYRLLQSIAEVEREKPTVVHLYIHRRSPLAPSVSISCTRVETLLRLARIPYEAHVISDPSVSPSGELPFVSFSGLRIAGAEDITDALARQLDVSLDRNLSPEDQATGTALLSAVRYSLLRGYMRSVHVDKPDVMKPYYSEMNRTPDWVTWFALRRMRKRLSSVNETSGYNQLSSAQYVHELLRDVRAIEALLEHHVYLFSSDYPCSYDCALYAWLLPVVAMEDAAEVNEAFAYIVESELLTNYVHRMTELAFPDLDELVYGLLEEEGGGGANAEERDMRPQSLTSEEEPTPRSRERSKSQASWSSGKRPRMRLSESLRRTVETAAAVEEDGEGEVHVRPSQREVRLPGEHWDS